MQNYPNYQKNFSNLVASKSQNQYLEEKTANQFNFDWRRTKLGLINTETDFQLSKINLRLVKIQKKISKNYF